MSGAISFVQQYYPFAQNVSSQTGLPVDFILGQSALETGYGQSNAAVNYNNFFGIKPGGTLAQYSSVQSGFDAYANLLESPPYSQPLQMALQNGATPTQLAATLAAAGYTPDAGYAGSVGQATSVIDRALQSLGLSGGSVGQLNQLGQPTGSASTNNGQQSVNDAMTLGSPGNILFNIGQWLQTGAFLLLAIVVIAAGLIMLHDRGKV